MSDDVDTKSETDGKSDRKPLSLRRTETGAVKQSFSHGRSKTVVVETKRRRVLTPKKPGDKPAETKATAPKETKAKKPESKSAKPGGAVLRTLSEDEKQARAAALLKARQEEDVRRKQEAAARAEREAREAEERAREGVENAEWQAPCCCQDVTVTSIREQAACPG
ncbi:MAG: IF-2-associated domain-containing protein, partial [Bacteroidota bacterium]